MTPEAAEALAAARIREARTARRISQARLAEMVTEKTGLKLDPTAITRIERGQRSIGFAEAVAITSVLGMTLSELSASPGTVAGCEHCHDHIEVLQGFRRAARDELVRLLERQLQAARSL